MKSAIFHIKVVFFVFFYSIEAAYLVNKDVDIDTMEKLPEMFAAEEDSVIKSLEEKWLQQKYCEGQPLGFQFADYDRHNIKLPCEIYDKDEFSEMLESLKSRSWKSSAEEMRNWYRLSCGIATTGINFEKILERLDTTGDEEAKLNDGMFFFSIASIFL